ncbi:uncharacterized protein CEXT_465181 [Caerostris extrusa]|uniref:LisH domain-containing protein n=1 Tax=Caerostris extrusa TaxID=172846 RepID=A0AAV4WSE8_CAEEX|nr:uncharacterized protein CEXT_465181 [Caerostris extrusa]
MQEELRKENHLETEEVLRIILEYLQKSSKQKQAIPADSGFGFHIAKRKSADFPPFPNGHGWALFSYTCCSCLLPIYLYLLYISTLCSSTRIYFEIPQYSPVCCTPFPPVLVDILENMTWYSFNFKAQVYLKEIYYIDTSDKNLQLERLVVFENYSEPADLLRNELSMLNDEDCDPVYMAPIDDTTRSSSWGANEEEDMYCVPYEDSDVAPPLPSPCLGPGMNETIILLNHL